MPALASQCIPELAGEERGSSQAGICLARCFQKAPSLPSPPSRLVTLAQFVIIPGALVQGEPPILFPFISLLPHTHPLNLPFLLPEKRRERRNSDGREVQQKVQEEGHELAPDSPPVSSAQ